MSQRGLQWGRRFLTAETQTAVLRAVAAGAASMGPPFFDGGNQELLGHADIRTTGFNGAAVF